MRPIVTVAAALVVGVAMSVVGLHSPAAAAVQALPADCTINLYPSGATNANITCADRPADQQWRMRAFCSAGFMPLDIISGSIVTGNGSSTGIRDCGAGWIMNEGMVLFEVI